MLEVLYRAKNLENLISSELVNMWKRELGATLILNKQEPKVYYASQREGDFHLSPSGWVGDYNDPNTFLDMFVSGGGNNRTGYASESYDRYVALAASLANTEERNGCFAKAEKLLISNDCVLIPLYHYLGVQFFDKSRLGGVEANLVDDHPFREMFWKE